MKVRCPKCGSRGMLRDELAGRTVRCPRCQGRFPAREEPAAGKEAVWYYAAAGRKEGPVGEAEFARLLAAGDIVPATLVWRKGMATWRPWGEMQGLVATGVDPAAPGLGRRLSAKILDLIFLLTLASLVDGTSRKLFPNAFGAGFPLNQIQCATIAVILVLGLCYLSWFTGKFGATPGKMVMGLKVVSVAGQRIGYGRALVRGCVEFLLIPGSAAFCWPWVSRFRAPGGAGGDALPPALLSAAAL